MNGGAIKKKCGAVMTVELREHGDGIWTAPGARVIDRTGRKRLPIGDDGFSRAAAASVLVDKTALIADVLDSGYTATLFCRPRRFGKTLNMTMMKAFFEAPPAGVADPSLFEGTEIWELDGGSYREYFAAYPVIYLSMRTAKGNTWEQTYGALKDMIAAEFARHPYLLDSENIGPHDKGAVRDILSGSASESDFAGSVLFLARLLRAHHGRPVVLLIDEYDAPVMAGYSASDGGYYSDVVAFLKRLLTGPLKDGGEVLAFACLTGVQRISKESIFSDLNNLVVSTALSTDSDERFGFTSDEVASLISYMGYPDEEYANEARRWYDGYRFGNAEVYNPWSLLNYINYGCSADVYWGNTSGNVVVGDLIRSAMNRRLRRSISYSSRAALCGHRLIWASCSLRWGSRATPCGACSTFPGTLRRIKPPCLTTRCRCALCGFRTSRSPDCTVPRSSSDSWVLPAAALA